MKPSWDDAPEWANWLAQDKDGELWWYEYLPSEMGRFEKWKGGIANKNTDWRDTLEPRPRDNSFDPVNAPPHYTEGGIEAIDYIAAKLGPEGFRAYCLGNVLKYVSRWQHKDGEQDLRKAQVYLGWAINGKPTREG